MRNIAELTFFFCGGRGLNPKPYVYYTSSLPTELSSRKPALIILIKLQLFYDKEKKCKCDNYYETEKVTFKSFNLLLHNIFNLFLQKCIKMKLLRILEQKTTTNYSLALFN